ncbi:MAG: MCE family protein [Magnetococcales bacterium]|nr:MCE family protein [Magnetococcales bacterium]
MSEAATAWKIRDRMFKQATTLFVLISMVLVLGIIWLGNTDNNPFDAKYYLQMELDHAEGLKKETPVTLAGIMVGKVYDLKFTETNKILVTLRLLKKYMAKIHQDSVVTLVKPFVGSVSLDIRLGSADAPVLQNDQRIAFSSGGGISELLAQVPEILTEVDSILTNVKQLTAQFVDPVRPFQQSMAHVNTILLDLAQVSDQLAQKGTTLQQIIDHLEQLSNGAATLMQSVQSTTPKQVERLVWELQKSLQMVQPVLGQVREVLQNTNRIAADVAKVTEQLGKISPEVPVLVRQGKEVMRETESLMRRVNNSVLFGGSAGKAGADSRLTHTPRDLPSFPPLNAP